MIVVTPSPFTIIVGTCLALVCQVPAQDQPAAKASSAYLSITSKTAGQQIFLDDAEIGKTPLYNYAVNPGKHQVAVRRAQSESWMDADWVREFDLAAGDTLVLQAEFILGYAIDSKPFGAEVWVDGQLLGTTPFVLRLPEGESANVEISMPGYRQTYLMVGATAENGEPSTKRPYEVTLEKDLTYDESVIDEAAAKHLKHQRYRKYAYIAAGVSLASGIAAVLLKREADNAFEAYLQTGDPQRQDELFSRAERYDTYSGIAFVGLQVSFAFTLFSFYKSTR